MSAPHSDIVVVGGGMAGASIAAELAAHASVRVIEAEDQPGYHATGRSVAFWNETYGGPAVQPLTTASGPLLSHPDPDFAERPFVSHRGAVHIARAESREALDALAAEFDGSAVQLEWMDRDALHAAVPGLRGEWIVGLSEPSCKDIDVGALHAAYLRQLRRRGGVVVTSAPLRSAERVGGRWQVDTAQGQFSADVLVNAAGAWADMVAECCGAHPIGIRPLRRTVVQLRTDPAPPLDLPLILDAAGQFYFKPEGRGRLWVSPHDETPSLPCDAAPEEVDVALAIDRLEQAVDWRVEALERRWAGLRSFAPDRAPVYGFDARVAGFFWFAGQGGFGMQTAPAAALLASALLTGRPMAQAVAAIDPGPYAAGRFA